MTSKEKILAYQPHMHSIAMEHLSHDRSSETSLAICLLMFSGLETAETHQKNTLELEKIFGGCG